MDSKKYRYGYIHLNLRRSTWHIITSMPIASHSISCGATLAQGYQFFEKNKRLPEYSVDSYGYYQFSDPAKLQANIRLKRAVFCFAWCSCASNILGLKHEMDAPH